MDLRGRSIERSSNATPIHTAPIPILSPTLTGMPVNGRLELEPGETAPELPVPPALGAPPDASVDDPDPPLGDPPPKGTVVVVPSEELGTSDDPAGVVGVVAVGADVGGVLVGVVVAGVVVEDVVDWAFAVHV